MTTANKKYEVQPLFATPYFRANLSEIFTPELVEFIKSLKMIPNQQNLITEDLYIFELPEMKAVKDAVQDALDLYASEVMGIEQRLYVTQSWALANAPGVGMHAHSHSNSLISGSLYFAELPEPRSKMIFEKYTHYRQLEINPAQAKQNVFNTPVNVVLPNTHDLILFPSELNHMVEPNTSNVPRYSIAFNTFLKGQIGHYRDVSELTL